MKVFVYTGNIVKLDVDTIGCAVNHRHSGGLANAIEKEAGSRYYNEKEKISRYVPFYLCLTICFYRNYLK